MEYFGKPTAYKNISTSQYTYLGKIKNSYHSKFHKLLDQISSQSAKDSSCTCS